MIGSVGSGGGLMEPETLGVAAVALLASKFGEGVAKDAGESAWNAVKALRKLVVAKFHGDHDTAAAITARAPTSTDEAKQAAAARITAVVPEDASFAASLEQLVATAQRDHDVGMIVARAFDQAKQVNIGTINL
ncbi:hypothetical protein [Nocardia alni]|uniref:hypothetical protein n=1 Tax=Nocardia alni TaxID=2815723 RepID=UPI001C24D591|nr:hypothetical protein [Nocardia alni]